MARTSFIEHKGVRIAFLDFANVQSPDEALVAIEEAGRIVQAEPFRSVRTLTHVSGSRFNGEVLEAVKRLAVNNRPYVIAGAVVGLSGLQNGGLHHGHAVLEAEHPGLRESRGRQGLARRAGLTGYPSVRVTLPP